MATGDIAEVPLPVDERVAEREILREPDHCVVNALIAVRVVFADHVSDDAGALLVRAGGIEPQQPHRPQQPAMDRLQPVANVREGARGDRRKGVDEVPLGQCSIKRRLYDGGFGIRVHCPRLAMPERARHLR